jgi:hypothetical protein
MEPTREPYVWPTIWGCKQNPRGQTDQPEMRNINIRQGVLTMPYGHVGEERNNVLDNKYNKDGNSQDQDFEKKMKEGDIVVISYTGDIKPCVLAEVMSPVIYLIDTGKYYKIDKSKNITFHDNGDNGGIPFRPVGRRIRIIQENVIFPDKRQLGIQFRSLQQIKYEKNKPEEYYLNRNIIRELIR